MENVDQEIVSAVELITAANTPEVQLAAIHKFFVSDAGFNNPLCCVPRGPGSREQILGIYQWYREMSPTVHLKVESYAWDEQTSTIYLDVIQSCNIWFNPFKSAPARVLIRLRLVRDDSGRYLIAQQDDFIQPEDIVNLLNISRLAPLIHAAKRVGAIASNYTTWLFQCFGSWKPASTVGTRKES